MDEELEDLFRGLEKENPKDVPRLASERLWAYRKRVDARHRFYTRLSLGAVILCVVVIIMLLLTLSKTEGPRYWFIP